MSAGWWMFHGDLAHTGEVRDTRITAESVSALRLLHCIEVPGSVLSTPAVVGAYAYVGLANTLDLATQIGGQMLKIDLRSGEIVARYTWEIPLEERDTHGFCGMGCTPAVADGCVLFSAFNGKLYCLSEEDLSLRWVIDLRHADLAHNQPVTNDSGQEPKAAGWSSPVLHEGRVYVGMGEGENESLYGFVYCLDAATGDVIWIFCTCQYDAKRPNRPNELPSNTVVSPPPKGFTTYPGKVPIKGASVWSSIAYDPDLDHSIAPLATPIPMGRCRRRGTPTASSS